MIRWEPWICDMYWPPRAISKKHNILMGNAIICVPKFLIWETFAIILINLLKRGLIFYQHFSAPFLIGFTARERERHLLINISWSMQNSSMSFSPVWREWNGNLTISVQLKANKNIHVEQAFATFPSNLQLLCKGVMHLWWSQNMSNFKAA